MSFKRDQRALRLVLAMNVAYLICWSPYAILCFTYIFISKRYFIRCFEFPLSVLCITSKYLYYIGYKSFKVLTYYFAYKNRKILFNICFSVIGPMLSMVPTITVKSSVCINPILYIALNPQVR